MRIVRGMYGPPRSLWRRYPRIEGEQFVKKLRRLLVAITVGAAMSTLAVAPAHAAVPKLSSPIKYCRYFPHNGYGNPVSYSDYYSYCAQVYTTISSLTIRTGAATTFVSHGSLPGGLVEEFDCWVTGQYVDGNNTWLKLYSAAGAYYVSDRYVYTGPNIRTILGHC